MAKESLRATAGVEEFVSQGNGATPLQQALESLNINLEDELTRFRQSRSESGGVKPYSNQLKFRAKKRRSGPNLIQVQARTAGSQQATFSAPAASGPSATAHPPSTDGPTATPTAVPPTVPAAEQSAYSGPQSMATPQPYGPMTPAVPGRAIQRRGGAISPYQQIPDDYFESTEALLDSLPSPQDRNYGYDDVEYQPSWRDQLGTPLGIGALLLLLVGSAGFGYLVTSPRTAEFLRDNALVQSWRGERTDPVEVAPSAETAEADLPEPDTGLQGMGPDLSEDEFQDLDLDRLSTLDRDEATVSPAGRSLPADPSEAEFDSSESAPEARPVGPRSGEEAAATPPGATADRAGRRNPDPTTVTRPQGTSRQNQAVNASPPVRATPSTTSVTPLPQTIQTPRPIQQVPPQPVRTAPAAVPTSPPQPLDTNPTPQPLSQPQAAPPAPLPQAANPQAAGTAPAPLTQSPPQPSPSYYVVADYTGDQSLQTARGAVGGAYVRNFPNGARIQMGAFSQETAARNLVQQLQGQGIPAQVYTP